MNVVVQGPGLSRGATLDAGEESQCLHQAMVSLNNSAPPDIYSSASYNMSDTMIVTPGKLPDWELTKRLFLNRCRPHSWHCLPRPSDLNYPQTEKY